MVKQLTGMFLVLLLIMRYAQADNTPYLLELIQQAKPNTAVIEKAKKQVSDHQDIKLQKISLVPFHLRKKTPINDSTVYCTECHGTLPHLKSLRSRAFLNMHTDYIACETCHFKPDNTTLHYGWYDYHQEKLLAGTAEFFHSGRKKDDKTWVSRDGHLKIVPLLNQQPVIASRNHPAAKALYKQWKDADIERKGTLKAQYHQPLQSKGPECSACHNDLQNTLETEIEVDGKVVKKITQPPLLDYIALGATPAQQTAIRQNTIADFFGHYQPEKPKTEGEPAKNGLLGTEQANDPTNEERIKITNFLK